MATTSMESSTSLAPEEVMAQSLPSASHHHRHIRYATPETSAPPHFILEAASNNHRSASSNHRASSRASRTMSASPPPAIASASQLQHPSIPVPDPEVDGQDHDRMEADEGEEGSDGSDSEVEDDPLAPASGEHEVESGPPPDIADEVMDTSPDNPISLETHPQAPAQSQVTPLQASVGVIINPAMGESSPRRLVHVHIPSNDAQATEVVQPLAMSDSEPSEAREAREERLRTAEEELAATEMMRTPERSRTERDRREGGGEDGEGDDDSDESTDEEEHPYWVKLNEDTSSPDERELKMIEENGNETSAMDHDYWEKLFYEPLEDPEYIPLETGRITWTVNGVHGTAEKPNRERIMRSPSVLIGEYYWNIKYYPHGNDGTEQLSIYIECSPTPYEEADTEPTKPAASGPNRDTTEVEGRSQDAASGSINGEIPAPSDSVNETSAPSAPEEDMEATPTPSSKGEPKVQPPWGIAAQISCVLYNPEEPRVHAYQKGCHRYYNDNPDWGWTRFHGPWDEIHKRQRFQRQALLRNDTLAFTAYIRTVRDDTKALWWHPPKDKSEWNSGAMTGVRAFECQEYQSSAMIAALSSWMHLSTIERLIRTMDNPDPVWEAHRRMRPAFEELQDLYDEGSSSSSSDEHDLNLRGLVSILNFYGAKVDSKMDVVKIWESLRRILNFESSGLDSIEEGNGVEQDQFSEVLLLKQPDLPNNADPKSKYLGLPPEGNQISSTLVPHSVQETLDQATQNEVAAFRTWQSFEGQRQNPPSAPLILQIELHRQDYDKDDRKWKKLTHRITIDETIVFNGCGYTLYGIIVHSGDLESKEYCSVIRPEGPGTRWIKYAGDSHERKVAILTSKQAVEAHEGTGDKADGIAAIAHIVMYVRTSGLPEALCTPFKNDLAETTSNHDMQALSAPQEDEMMDVKDNEAEIPVYIYGAEAFVGHAGRGICDPWVYQRENQYVKELTIPTSTTVAKIKDHVAHALFPEMAETSEVRLWPMNTFASDSGAGTFPGLLSHTAHLEESLEEMGQNSGGCRFWMTIADKAPAPPPPETTTPEPTSEMDLAREQQERDAALQAVILSIQADDEETAPPQVDTEMTGDGQAPQETERQRQETDRQRRRRQQQLLRQMQQAQEQQRQQAAQQAQERRLQIEHTAQMLKETYFFVKVYDAKTQSLRGTGSAIVKSESKIVEETKKLLKVQSSEAWDCYHERSTELRSRDLVKANETFQSRCGGADGTIIIVQRRPTSAEYVAIVTSTPLRT